MGRIFVDSLTFPSRPPPSGLHSNVAHLHWSDASIPRLEAKLVNRSLESHWLGELPPKFLPSQNFDQHPMPGVQKKWTSENKLPQIPWMIINFHTSWYINTWTWLYIRGHTICINSTYQIKPGMFSLPPLSPKETRTNLGAAATRQRSIPWRRKATRFNGHLGCPRLEPALDPPVKIAFP